MYLGFFNFYKGRDWEYIHMEKMKDNKIGRGGETDEKKLVGHVEVLEEFSEDALKDVHW